VWLKANQNKDWGRDKWQVLADILALDGHKLVQIGSIETRPLKGVRLIVTPTFREGAAVLSRAVAAVLPEGGLHHAAAVVNVPAVVLFGGAIDPQATGYDSHVNLADDGPLSPCGIWRYCPHCAEIWRKLQPETVASALRAMLKDGSAIR
jgi:ADP-heptose:LPS heptosyltransferase